MYKAPGAGGVVGAGGGLAVTGADVVWWVAFGLVLIVSGLFAMRTMRQRDRAAS